MEGGSWWFAGCVLAAVAVLFGVVIFVAGISVILACLVGGIGIAAILAGVAIME